MSSFLKLSLLSLKNCLTSTMWAPALSQEGPCALLVGTGALPSRVASRILRTTNFWADSQGARLWGWSCGLWIPICGSGWLEHCLFRHSPVSHHRAWRSSRDLHFLKSVCVGLCHVENSQAFSNCPEDKTKDFPLWGELLSLSPKS